MARKKRNGVSPVDNTTGDEVYLVSAPTEPVQVSKGKKPTAGQSAYNAALDHIVSAGNGIDAIETAIKVPITQALAQAGVQVNKADAAVTKPIIDAVQTAKTALDEAYYQANLAGANQLASAMSAAGPQIMDYIEQTTLGSISQQPVDTFGDISGGIYKRPAVPPVGVPGETTPQSPGVLTPGIPGLQPPPEYKPGEPTPAPQPGVFVPLVAPGGFAGINTPPSIPGAFYPEPPGIGFGGSVYSGNCACYRVDEQTFFNNVLGGGGTGAGRVVQTVNQWGNPVGVVLVGGSDCNVNAEDFASQPSGYYVCGNADAAAPTPVPPQQPPQQPQQPPGEQHPPEKPPEQPCLKICGFPPDDGGKKDGKKPDLCKECVGVLWFNKKTCTLKVFIENCPPPRTEYEDWIKLGSPTSADDLVKRLKENKCIKEDKRKTKPQPRVPGGGVASSAEQFCDLLTPALAAGDNLGIVSTINNIVQRLADADLPGLFPGDNSLNVLAKILGGLLKNGGEALSQSVGQLLELLAGAEGCFDPRIITIINGFMSIGIIDKYVSDIPDSLLLPFRQQLQYACPTGVPSPQEATAAYISGTIDAETWRCWVRAGNQKDAYYDRVKEAARTKLSVFELIRLNNRKEITDQQLSDGIRALGYIRDDEDKHLKTLAEYLPGPQDIVRFMLRDVADPDIVQRFGLDAEFEQKLGDLRDYADWQNVPEKLMRYYWRAHWNIPAPTQLYEFFQRFRNRPELWPSGNDPLADLKAALVQQDILPKWHPLFIESIFRRPTRVDTRRMLEAGVIDRQQAVTAWQELGYNDTNADNLVKLAEQTAKKRALNHSAVKRRATGEITDDEMRQLMHDDGIAEKYIEPAYQRAALNIIAARRKKCIAAYRKRFLHAEFDTSKALELLAGQQVTGNHAQQIVSSWQCELSSRGKEVGGAQLCTWFTDGLISLQEFYVRLIRVGYDETDASRVVQECQLRIDRKLAAAEKKRLIEQVRKAKADATERRKLERTAASIAATAARNLRSQVMTAKQREALLLRAAEAMSAKTGDDTVEAKRTINVIYRDIKNQTGVAADQLTAYIAEASELPEVDGYDTLETTVYNLVLVRVFAVPLEQTLP